MAFQKTYTAQMALPKIRHYCAYQERSHAEVKTKLYGYGLRKNEVEEMIASLIQDNYLNEERFATSFARGKFRMKKWGRIKIRYELKLKQVSEYNIRKAMESIDPDDYQKTLRELASKKFKSIKGSGITTQVKKIQTSKYLQQRGFELPLIQQVLTQFLISD